MDRLILDGDDPTMIVGFEMEQMILPRLTGRHVPRFIANGDFATQPYIVMERVVGRSLYERMGEAPFPPDEVARIGLAVATALRDLHRHKVLHLDIKPANVIIRDDGTAVLVDFGLARHLTLPDLLAEEFRVPMGTAPYIAPEQVLKARDDPRSDIFALGAVLYEMVTGRQPFGDPKGSRGMRQRLWADPWPPRALRSDCPAWLQEIILRCLAVDPAGRYPTAAQLCFDLAHPDQVRLTALAEKMKRDPVGQRLRRWFRAAGAERPAPYRMEEGAHESPIVVAAVDLSDDYCDVAAEVRAMAGRMLTLLPGARLACVNVLTQRGSASTRPPTARAGRCTCRAWCCCAPGRSRSACPSTGSPTTCWRAPIRPRPSSPMRARTTSTRSSWARVPVRPRAAISAASRRRSRPRPPVP